MPSSTVRVGRRVRVGRILDPEDNDMMVCATKPTCRVWQKVGDPESEHDRKIWDNEYGYACCNLAYGVRWGHMTPFRQDMYRTGSKRRCARNSFMLIKRYEELKGTDGYK